MKNKNLFPKFTAKTLVICILLLIFSLVGRSLLNPFIPNKKTEIVFVLGMIYYFIIIYTGIYYLKKSFKKEK